MLNQHVWRETATVERWAYCCGKNKYCKQSKRVKKVEQDNKIDRSESSREDVHEMIVWYVTEVQSEVTEASSKDRQTVM
jgi:hypothetical protein